MFDLEMLDLLIAMDGLTRCFLVLFSQCVCLLALQQFQMINLFFIRNCPMPGIIDRNHILDVTD